MATTSKQAKPSQAKNQDTEKQVSKGEASQATSSKSKASQAEGPQNQGPPFRVKASQAKPNQATPTQTNQAEPKPPTRRRRANVHEMMANFPLPWLAGLFGSAKIITLLDLSFCCVLNCHASPVFSTNFFRFTSEIVTQRPLFQRPCRHRGLIMA